MREVKANFSNIYECNTECNFKCLIKEDLQEHMLIYYELLTHLYQKQQTLQSNVEYNGLFGSTAKQIRTAQMLQILVRIQESLLGKIQEPACHRKK